MLNHIIMGVTKISMDHIDHIHHVDHTTKRRYGLYRPGPIVSKEAENYKND